MLETLVRFEDVSYEVVPQKPILDETSFGIRAKMKMTLMGQNGAGKSTLFRLIKGEIEPSDGAINRSHGLSIALSRQVIPQSEMQLSVRAFFEQAFPKKIYDIDPKIEAVLEIVDLHAPLDRMIKSFSGGQQARLLLASALIQDPDLLLLDEPTNNLDKAGIAHLTEYLRSYEKTCVVISHDADFLNSFTQGVLYLDAHAKKIEQYVGNYFNVVEQISARIEKENRANAQLEKKIQANKDKINFFAHKGGKMRLIAKKMKDEVEEMEESKVDVRREDASLRPFVIPSQDGLSGDILKISSFSVLKGHVPVTRKKALSLRKNQHLLLAGPNGIGKSTLLESIAALNATHKDGLELAPKTVIGYYRQDFSNLDFDSTVYEALAAVMKKEVEQEIRSIAAKFLLVGPVVHTKISHLSEGQKALVAFARLTLIKPGLLILDEPTNHVNFRHLPAIAQALDSFQGAMILVSHVPEFVSQIRVDETLDLSK